MMYKKILQNNNKSNRIHGVSKGKVGTILGIQDKNGEYLVVGDKVRFGDYKGIILYDYYADFYVLALDYSLWYGTDKYDTNSYGKFVKLPMDNGARMELEKLE